MPEYLHKKIKAHDGRWVRIYGRTPEDLAEKVAARKSEYMILAAMGPQVTFNEYVQKWFRAGITQKRWSPATADSYRNVINNYICPAINAKGAKLLSDVSQDDIAAVMTALYEKSQSLQAKAVVVLRGVFAAAEEAELIRRSPCRTLKVTADAPEPREALTRKQQKTLLKAVEGTRAQTFTMIGLYSGLRREEILGLYWDCVVLDGKAPHIKVRRALRWEKNNKPTVLPKLKTKAARRDIPMPPALAARLRQEYKKCEVAVKARLGPDADPEAIQKAVEALPVIISKEGGPLSYSSYARMWGIVDARTAGTVMRRKMKRGEFLPNKVEVVKQLGKPVTNHKVMITIDFKVTPHILRHTYITELILGGVNIKKVQYLAGHSKIEETLNIYTHLMTNRPADMINDVTTVFPDEK